MTRIIIPHLSQLLNGRYKIKKKPGRVNGAKMQIKILNNLLFSLLFVLQLPTLRVWVRNKTLLGFVLFS